MICKIESTNIQELQDLINLLGQNEGLKAYLEGKTTDSFKQEDLLIAGSEKKFLPKEEDRIKREQQKLYDLKQALKKLNDPKEIKEQKIIIERQKNLITELQDQLEKFKSQRVVEDVYQQAELNLTDLENIFKQPTLSWDELVYSKDLISFWQAAGEFSEVKPHLFLDEDEANTPEIRERFIQYKNRVDVYAAKYLKLAQDMLAQEASKVTGKQVNKEELFKAQLDAWNLSSQTLNLGRLNQDLLNTIYTAVEQMSAKAEFEAAERWKELDEVSTKAMPGMKKIAQRLGLKNVWDIFRQKRANGLETGNTVFRFSQDYFDASQNLFNKAMRASKKTRLNDKPEDAEMLKKSSKKAWKEFYSWKTNNTVTLDVRKLFPDSNIEDSDLPEEFIYSRKTYADNIIDQHKKHLIEQLGAKGYEVYYQDQLKKVEEFKNQREIIWGQIQLEDISEVDKKVKMEEWLRTNSPYWALDMEESEAMRTRKDGSYYTASYQYNKYVPLRYYPNNKKTGWYDETFDLIEQDADVLAFYDLVIKTIKESNALFGDHADFMQMNSVPFIKHQIIDMFMERGMVSAGAGLYNNFISSLRTDDISNQAHGRINPKTGALEKELNIRVLTERKDEIKAIVDLKIAQFRLDNKTNPSYEDKKRFEQEAVDELSKDKSFDLVRVMKAYSLAALSYKYKSSIEPFVRTADDMFRQIHKAKTNRGGNILSQGELIVTDEKLTNMQAALDYYLDVKYWGNPKQKMELVAKKKVYTPEETKLKKELETLREELVKSLEGAKEELKVKINSDIANIDYQLDQLGGHITGSQIGNNLLKWVQLKGMGWNVLGALSNIGFGNISNWTLAADGRLFNQKELRKAYIMALSSITKNATFNQLELGQAKKIRNLMDKLDILQESSRELLDRGIQSSFMKRVKTFGPYNLNQRAEYLNQSPIMVAMMLHDGIWDYFDNEGNIKPDVKFTQEDLIKFKLKVARAIEMTHGDYRNPLRFKSIFFGRALGQFRSWAIEGFASRFEGEKFDTQLGMDIKGRYRTGFGIVSWANDTGMNSFKQTLFNLKQLGRKLLFMKTQYDEAGFSEVDAANMRKNLNELLFYLSIISFTLILYQGLDDDDEEKTFRTVAINVLLNQSQRMQTDVLFYTSPLEFQKLNKNVLPIFQIVNDASNLATAIEAQFGDSPDYEKGDFEGMNRVLRTTGEATPIVNQGFKLYKNASYILGEK